MNSPTGVYEPHMMDLPPECQVKIRAGVPLFELRLPHKATTDKEIFGPFEVNVIEDEDAPFNSPLNRRFRYDWRTSRDAYIKYSVDKHGNGVCFMPDDPWWHNRLYLVDSPRTFVANLRKRDGAIISGAEVRIEIDCLRDELKHERKIFKVLRNGKEISFHFAKADAKAEIDDLLANESVLKMHPGSKQLVQTKTKRYKYDIDDKGTFLTYKPEIEELINIYGPRGKQRQEYGWTQCQQFQEDIKKKVMEEVAKRRKEFAHSSDAGDIFSTVSNMTPEERDKLKSMLGLGGGNPGGAPPPAGLTAPKPVMGGGGKTEVIT